MRIAYFTQSAKNVSYVIQNVGYNWEFIPKWHRKLSEM